LREGTPETLFMGQSTNIVVHEEQYYALKPQRNAIFKLLDDLKNYRVNLKTLNEEL
jgi:hypothetical protein